MLQTKSKQITIQTMVGEAALASAMDKRGMGQSSGLFPFVGYLEFEHFPQSETRKVNFYQGGRRVSAFVVGIENVKQDDDLQKLFSDLSEGKAGK